MTPCALFALAKPVAISALAWSLVAGAELAAGAALAAALLAAGRARLAAWTVAAAGGLLLAWHARELLWEPWHKLLFAGATAAVTAALFLASRSGAARTRRAARWCGFATALCAVLLAVLSAAAWRLPGVRVVLLRYDRPLGTPVYGLLDGDPEAALRRAQRAPSSPPAAIHDGLATAQPRAAAARSVVVLLVDTLRADALAPWGGGDRLPGFEALASSGVVLTDVLAGTSWTKPSVASLFTGLEQEEHGVRGLADALAASRVTLAERFAAAGYDTAAFSTNLAQINRASGFARGFRDFVELRGRGGYANAAQLGEAVERWLAARHERGGGTALLFLYAHFIDPHVPYRSGDPPRTAWPAAARPAYRAEVGTVDRELARLVPVLRARLGDPVIALLSDHGEEFGEHGGFGHGATLYAEVVRVPAMVAGVATTGDGRLDSALELRDFYDLLPRFAAGEVDVASWAAAHAREVRRCSLYSRRPGMPWHRPYLRAVAARRLEERRWVYVRSSYGETEELFDRLADPLERRDLAAEQPREVARLAALLDTLEPRWSASEPARLDAGVARQLHLLGYL